MREEQLVRQDAVRLVLVYFGAWKYVGLLDVCCPLWTSEEGTDNSMQLAS